MKTFTFAYKSKENRIKMYIYNILMRFLFIIRFLILLLQFRLRLAQIVL